MAFPLIVNQKHFEYLRLQKGSLDKYADNFPLWFDHYKEGLQEDFDLIEFWLPEKCQSLLDVGSGLGGIDALINHYYGGEVAVRLLDGEDDPPLMKLHRQTFNNMDVARDFLKLNGVGKFSYVTPYSAIYAGSFFVSDLVLSLGSWCFHYPASLYLPFVKRSLAPGGTLIVDVRNDHDDWLADLLTEFDEAGVVAIRKKWTRRVFRARH